MYVYIYIQYMKIVNVAFLIPIHPPHYHFIYNLLNKCKSNNIEIDIFLIFSNNVDYDNFNMKNEIQPIICDSLNPHSIITYKKFFGLKQLANSKYDYIICCDSEIDIICDNFTNEIINNKIQNIFTNKKIYAGDTDDILAKKITESSANVFPNNIDVLKNITNNFTMYFWWSLISLITKILRGNILIMLFINIICYCMTGLK